MAALLAAGISLPAGAPRWTATFGGVGPLKLGMSLATVSRVLGERLAAPKVPGADRTGRCFYVDPRREPAVQLMIIDGRLARVDVAKRGIETANGISIGDTKASVLAAYGSQVKVTPHFYYPHHGNYLTVLSADGKYGIRFEVIYGKVVDYYSGTAQTIRYVEGCA